MYTQNSHHRISTLVLFSLDITILILDIAKCKASLESPMARDDINLTARAVLFRFRTFSVSCLSLFIKNVQRTAKKPSGNFGEFRTCAFRLLFRKRSDRTYICHHSRLKFGTIEMFWRIGRFNLEIVWINVNSIESIEELKFSLYNIVYYVWKVYDSRLSLKMVYLWENFLWSGTICCETFHIILML